MVKGASLYHIENVSKFNRVIELDNNPMVVYRNVL